MYLLGAAVQLAGPQTVTLTIRVEEPVFLTLQAGNADDYEAELRELRDKLSSVHGQLADSHTLLADSGGSLKAAQERLAETHAALNIERQKTLHFSQEVLEGLSGQAAVESHVSAVAKSEQASTATSTTDQLHSPVAIEAVSAAASTTTDQSHGPHSTAGLAKASSKTARQVHPALLLQLVPWVQHFVCLRLIAFCSVGISLQATALTCCEYAARSCRQH